MTLKQWLVKNVAENGTFQYFAPTADKCGYLDFGDEDNRIFVGKEEKFNSVEELFEGRVFKGEYDALWLSARGRKADIDGEW